MHFTDQVSDKNGRRFSQNDLRVIESSEQNQIRFKEWVVISRRFSKQEKAALKIDSIVTFSQYWQGLQDAKEDFDRSHDKGYGLWGQRYQNSAASIQPFMDSLAPIVEIVKDFGAPYGGVAVGVISLLFSVAGNKDKLEGTLVSAIETIQDRLPGLELYQHIYSENNQLDLILQSKFVMTYQTFMDFCIMATTYYKIRGPRRWMRALRPMNAITERVESIKEQLVEIRHICEELLNRNVSIIKQLNIDLKEENSNLKAQLNELQDGHDQDLLNEVQLLLNLSNFSEEEHREEWMKHDHAVDGDENLNLEVFQQMRGPALQAFKAPGTVFQQWQSSKQSCFLVLSGYNNYSIDGGCQCWLSPVATSTVRDLTSPDSQELCTYYALPQNGKLLWDVVGVLLLQLLRQKSSVLRSKERRTELRTQLEKFHQADFSDAYKVAAIARVGLRAIDLFDESQTLYLIIDRVDRCRDHAIIDHRKPLLNILIRMVEATRCKLKVLAVVDGNSWRVERYEDELEVKRKEWLIIHTAEQGATY